MCYSKVSIESTGSLFCINSCSTAFLKTVVLEKKPPVFLPLSKFSITFSFYFQISFESHNMAKGGKKSAKPEPSSNWKKLLPVTIILITAALFFLKKKILIVIIFRLLRPRQSPKRRERQTTLKLVLITNVLIKNKK
jgi:hypothetical protein